MKTQLFPAEILPKYWQFWKKVVMPSFHQDHQVRFSYPSASASHSQPAGHPWLSPWPSLDTPVAQSRSEDSGFGPWHLHSATPSETPQCGDSNSGGERMERMEGGWSMKRLEKDVMRQLLRRKKYQKHSNYICAYTRICSCTCVSRVLHWKFVAAPSLVLFYMLSFNQARIQGLWGRKKVQQIQSAILKLQRNWRRFQAMGHNMTQHILHEEVWKKRVPSCLPTVGALVMNIFCM